MALAVDSSSPPIVTVTSNTPTTITTASFTPPANSLLYIRWSWNTNNLDTPAAPTITDSLGSPLTYTLIDHARRPDTTADGQAAHWWAVVGGSPTAMTITVTRGTGTNNQGGALCVAVITGANNASPIGAHGKGASTSASSIAQSYTAQATNAQGFIGVCDWDLKGAETAGTGCTLTTPAGGSANVGAEITYAYARRSSADDTNGSNNTLNLTLPAASTNLYWVYAEIMPAATTATYPPPNVRSRRPVPFRVARSRQTVPVRAQVNPPYPFAEVVQPRRPRGWLLRRGKQAQPVGPTGLVRTNLLGQITNSTGTANFTTSAFTPANNSLLVVAGVFVENAAASDPTSAFVISDSLGTLTWTQQLTAVVSPTSFPTLIKIWTTPITTGTSMTITLSTGGLNRLGYAVSIVCYTGYDTVTPIGTSVTGIQNGGFGTPPNPVSLTLPQAPLATSEVFAAIGIDKSTADTTPGSTFTEIHDVTDTANDTSLETEARTGSTSTTVDWVDLRPGGGNLFNYAAAVIEVRAAGSPSNAAAFPFAAILQPRRVRGMLPKRGKQTQVVPPQFNPPFPFVEVVQPRRVRGWLLRRGKQGQTVPIPQEPPVPEIVQPRRLRGMRPRKAKPVETVPPQFNPPYPFAEVVQPRRIRGLLLRRGKQAQPVPVQDGPLADVAQPRRFRGLLPRRAKPIETVPAQVNVAPPPYPPQTLRARVKWYLIDRGRLSQPVPPQVTFAPVAYVPQTLRSRVKSYLIDRGRISQQPVPPQFNPPYPFQEIAQPRRLRGMLARRGRQAQPVPVQDGPIGEVAQPRRQRGWLLRRGRTVLPVPPQDMPVQEIVQPRRARGWLLRRSKQAAPVPPQVVLAPPTYPPQDMRSRLKMQRLAPRGKVWQPPWPQSINPIPFRDAIWSFGHLGLKWVLNVVLNGKWKTGTVEGLKWFIGDIDRSKWSFGLAASKWSIGGVIVPNPDIPLSSLSLEYVRVPVSATVNGAAINPTADTVKMAFLSAVGTQPQVSDWKTASWDSVSANGTYFAQCLVGPGGAVTLTAGTYYVWIQITDNPEVPVRQVGVLQVV